MLTNEKVMDLRYCRSCLNKKYKMALQRSDIESYYTMLNVCKCCQQQKNIVYSIKPLSRWKLLMAKPPRARRSRTEKN